MKPLKPRISMITLGVYSVDNSARFYRGLGFPQLDSPPSVAFFELNGTWLGIFGRVALADDAGVSGVGTGFNGISLSHNVESEAEVSSVFSAAIKSGAKSIKSPQKSFWGGFHAYFCDPDNYLWEIAHNPFMWVGPTD